MRSSVLRAVALAFGFLTRLPIDTARADEHDFGLAVAFFPVVGAALGAVLAAVAWLFGAVAAPPLLAVGLVALLAAVTGGLHLDGLADVFDALGGGHGDRERTLAIMRDSRIGAHGAVALVIVLLAKTIAMTELVRRGDSWMMIAFPAAARWAIVPLVVFFPYARERGLGGAFKAHASVQEAALATTMIVAIGLWAGGRFVAAAAAALVVALAWGGWMQRRLGGLTGDVYGAAIELAELAFLVAVSAGAGW